jgi:hypothetical protein
MSFAHEPPETTPPPPDDCGVEAGGVDCGGTEF